jgi:hypothetical protein
METFMSRKQELLQRLDAIGESLARTEHAVALLGLGSVGAELDRLDEFSDLDFFVIVQPGYKAQFIENLDWLEHTHAVAYCFKNTPDGYKVLFADGIFCEFAVFEAAELLRIPFAAGRIVWKAADFDDALCLPPKNEQPTTRNPIDWLVGEAVTNLYVGLGRARRGEKLSATRFIQGYAVDRILELSDYIETTGAVYADPFARERRYEQRFPGIARYLPQFIQGYDHIPESAQAILDFLDDHFGVNPAMKQAVEARLKEG